ncbi:hypothetical protein KM043_009292 [Ampulex compressa]|nr:hypothetical protein KM043_009292 [Ampulex compressa]
MRRLGLEGASFWRSAEALIVPLRVDATWSWFLLDKGPGSGEWKEEILLREDGAFAMLIVELKHETRKIVPSLEVDFRLDRIPGPSSNLANRGRTDPETPPGRLAICSQ